MPVQQDRRRGVGASGRVRVDLGDLGPPPPQRRGGACRRSAARRGEPRAPYGTAGARGGAAAGGRQQPGPERGERVVGDAPRPDELPQRKLHLVDGRIERRDEVADEPTAAAGQLLGHPRHQALGVVEGLEGGGLGQREGRVLSQVQGHPPVPARQGPSPDPQNLPGRGQLVQPRGLVLPHPSRQHQRLHGTGRQERPIELFDGGEQTCHPTPRFAHVLPGRQESRERIGADGLGLVPQGGHRPATQQAQHVGVAPLGPLPIRAELALGQPAPGRKRAEDVPGHGHAYPESACHLLSGEGRGASGVPGDQVAERIVDRLGERVGDADRQGTPEAIAQPCRVLDRGQAFDAGHPDGDGPASRREGLDGPGGDGVVDGTRADLVRRQRTEQPQQVGDLLGVACAPVGGEPLQLELGARDHLGVQQLAELGSAEQLGEQGCIQRERLSTALGQRRVPLVHERGDVAEQQRAGERRRLDRLHLDDGDGSGADVADEVDQRGHVVDVLQALAHRLEQDRERPVPRGHRQQLRRALPLLPQGRAAAGVATGKQQRPSRALAEPGGEQSRPADLGRDQVVDLVRLEHHQVRARRSGAVAGVGALVPRVGQRVGDAEHHAVVGVRGLHVDSVPLAQPSRDGQGPRRVHACAVRRVHHQAPVTELVAEPLDEHGAVVGHLPRGRLLLGQVGDQVGRGPLVQPCRSCTPDCLLGGEAGQLAHEGAQPASHLGRTTDRVAVPVREPPRLPRSRGHQHSVVRDVLDAPGRRAEGEDVPDTGLVHHLLVELAHPRGLLAHQEDAEEPTVGDGAPAGDGQPLGPRSAREHAGLTVPDEPGAQLGELVAGEAARQQVEDRVEGRHRERRERVRPADEREKVVDLPVVHRDHRDHLLCQHVQRVARNGQGLDPAGAHSLDGDGARHEVAAVLREHDTAGHGPHLVPRTPHTLQATGHRRGCLDLHHQVDRAHVDAQLQAGRGHDRRQPSGLEVVLDQGTLLLAHRPVVRTCHERPLGRHRARHARLGRELRGRRARSLHLHARALGGGLVQPRRQPLSQASRVGEDEGAAVRLDEVEHTLLDVRPDRGPLLGAGCRPGDLAGTGPELGHVVDRDLDRQVELLHRRRLHHGDRSSTGKKGGHLVDRTDGGRQADALGRSVEQPVQPLQGEREVGAALGAGHGMDLVHDHRLDARQGRPGRRRQQQEQRLRGGDEDVGRSSGEASAVVGRGVAGARGDSDAGLGQAQSASGIRDAGQRGAQVAAHIHRQSLQRRDVQDATPSHRVVRHLADGQPVDRPEERRQRLARSRGGHHERVRALGHCRPRLGLGSGRLEEGAAKPLPRRGGEAVQGAHPCIVDGRGDTAQGEPCHDLAWWRDPYWRACGTQSSGRG